MKLLVLAVTFVSMTAAHSQAPKAYGERRLGLYFRTALKMETPFTLPQSYPRQEYWHGSGKLWVFNATIPRRHQIDDAGRKKLTDTFLFPAQTFKLKDVNPPPQAGAGEIKSRGGTVDIYKNNYQVKYLEVWRLKYVHIIAVFNTPDFSNQAGAVWQSIRSNQNFKW